MNSSLFLVVRTPVLLADFVRRADRRGTSERTSGGKAVTGARGSILHPAIAVKGIFKLFLGPRPCFVGFTPAFRLFSRTGETPKSSGRRQIPAALSPLPLIPGVCSGESSRHAV